MERSHNRTIELSTTYICALFVILFYVVGFFGFIHPEYSDWVKKIVPFHLLAMLVLMIISHDGKNKHFWIFLLTTYIAGFVVELLGVNTGVIFGEYTYGSTLGTKFADIPLLIGVNWILIIYSTGTFMKEFGIKNQIIRSLIGAFFITTLDFLIEPVAIKYDYWSWTDFDVPFQNYVGWFIFSFLMLRFFYMMRFRKHNLVAIILFAMQFVFFFFLNMKTV